MINKIIFSVFQKDGSEDFNYMNTIKVERMLERANIEYVALDGVYKGSKEASFALDLKHVNAAMELTEVYNQESILIVNELGQATLKYLPLTLTADIGLGYFTEVTKEVALTKDGYSLDLETGIYYTCLPERRQTDRISFNTKTWGVV